MARRRLGEDDLEALAIGAAILGTGGGGSPYVGRLRSREQLRMGRTIEILPLEELDDDALVVTVGGIGAPVIGVEKIEKGDECLRALRAIERVEGRSVDALISAEIGGANAMEPMLTAAQAGPAGGGRGRDGARLSRGADVHLLHLRPPAGARGPGGREGQHRRAAAGAGHVLAGTLRAHRRGRHGRRRRLRREADDRRVRQALRRARHGHAGARLGETVLEARRRHADPIDAVVRPERGRRVYDGKIVDVRREILGGFARGHVLLEGLDADAGREGRIAIQNENLILEVDGETVACVPDLIMLLDQDSGEPITTEVLRFGMRVAVIVMPCHPLLRTPEALAVVGPAAFGYPDVTYVPLEGEATHA